jgi:hypothetical protein
MFSTTVMMRHLAGLRIELLLCLLLCLMAMHAADSKVEFIGGTVPSFKAGQDGRLALDQADRMVFGLKQNQVIIRYNQIHSIEYGQKVDRRYVEAILLSPMFLLSKKRDHYLTVHYRDEKGYDQVIVLRLPKSSVRPTLASLEARTGLKVKVQDDEARKAYRS